MKMHYIQPTKEFLSKVNPVLDGAFSRCQNFLKLEKKIYIHLSFTDDKYVVGRMGGASGRTLDKKNIQISVNTKPKTWKSAVLSTAAHEFNHAIRMQYTKKEIDKDWKLIDTIALEGLGQICEEEITGKKAPYSKAVSREKAKKLWQGVKPRTLSFSDSFYRKLFFGWKKLYPVWGGYTMSYLIVKKRREELGLGWEELMKLDSKKLIGKGFD